MNIIQLASMLCYLSLQKHNTLFSRLHELKLISYSEDVGVLFLPLFLPLNFNLLLEISLFTEVSIKCVSQLNYLYLKLKQLD